jgi:hypothetical protein
MESYLKIVPNKKYSHEDTAVLFCKHIHVYIFIIVVVDCALQPISRSLNHTAKTSCVLIGRSKLGVACTLQIIRTLFIHDTMIPRHSVGSGVLIPSICDCLFNGWRVKNCL